MNGFTTANLVPAIPARKHAGFGGGDQSIDRVGFCERRKFDRDTQVGDTQHFIIQSALLDKARYLTLTPEKP